MKKNTIERMSWDETIEEYHSTPDWLVVAVSVGISIGVLLCIADLVFGAETVTNFIAGLLR